MPKFKSFPSGLLLHVFQAHCPPLPHTGLLLSSQISLQLPLCGPSPWNVSLDFLLSLAKLYPFFQASSGLQGLSAPSHLSLPQSTDMVAPFLYVAVFALPMALEAL